MIGSSVWTHAHVIISQAEGVDDAAVAGDIHDDCSDASGSAHSEDRSTAATRQWYAVMKRMHSLLLYKQLEASLRTCSAKSCCSLDLAPLCCSAA
jgi:hypothetical protein